jgi:biotin carboxyl carrier protein
MRTVLLVVVVLAHAAVAAPVTVDARIGYDDARVHRITAPATGTVRRVFKARGDRVHAGDRLFEIAYVEIVRPSAELDLARADVLAAYRGALRAQVLMERGEPRRDYEQARDDYHKARAAYDRLLQRAGRAREVTITAPVAGEVLAVDAQVGDPVFAADDPEQRPIGELGVIGDRDRVVATASTRCDRSWRQGVPVAFVLAGRPAVQVQGTITGLTAGGCAIATLDDPAHAVDEGASGDLVIEP